MPNAVRFEVSETLNASVEAVWRLLGDFGNEHRWATGFLECTRSTDVVRVGTIRTCTLPKPLMGRTQVREELIEYEPGEALAYRLHGPAGPFSSAMSRWSTRPVADGGTRVTVEGRFIVRTLAARWFVWPLIKPVLRRLTRSVINELGAAVIGT